MNNTVAPAPTRKTPDWRIIWTLVVLTLLVRGSVLVVLHDNLAEDRDLYRAIAESLRQSGVYGGTWRANESAADASVPKRIRTPLPTAYRPPLYPLVLAAIAVDGSVSSVSAGLLHLALGVATVALVYALGRLWQLGRWAAVAAALVACDPILLYWSTFVMTETLATFLAVLCLFLLTKLNHHRAPWAACLAGAALAAAALCRPVFLVWLAFAVLFVPLLKGNWKTRIVNLAAIVITAGVVLAPWIFRNYRQSGRPIVATTHGGYTFLLGNNPDFYRYQREAPWGTTWDSRRFRDKLDKRVHPHNFHPDTDVTPQNAIVAEATVNRVQYETAWRAIQNEPLMFVRACLLRIARLWTPLSYQLGADESLGRRVLRYAAAVWYVGLFVLALIGVSSLRLRIFRTPWLWGLLLCVSFTAVHTLYWSNMRMRAPLMPVVCFAAALGAARVAARIARRKCRSSNDLSVSG